MVVIVCWLTHSFFRFMLCKKNPNLMFQSCYKGNISVCLIELILRKYLLIFIRFLRRLLKKIIDSKHSANIFVAGNYWSLVKFLLAKGPGYYKQHRNIIFRYIY